MNGKANYTVVHVGANEIDDIDALADRVERALETANGFSIAARTMHDAQVIDPMKLALTLKISDKLNERQRAKNRRAPDGSLYRGGG